VRWLPLREVLGLIVNERRLSLVEWIRMQRDSRRVSCDAVIVQSDETQEPADLA
jgi:hypothetical protein